MKVAAEESQPVLPSAWALLKPSWAAARVNTLTFIYLALTPITLVLVAGVFARAPAQKAAHVFFLTLGWLMLATALALWSVSIPAITYVRLQSVRNERVQYGEALRKGVSLFYRWWVLQVVLFFVVAGGFVLLIVPGFYMLRRAILARYFLVDTDKAPLEALRASADVSKRYGTALWSTTFLLSSIFAAYLVLPGAFGVLWLLVMSIWNLCGTALRYEEVTRTSIKKDKSKKQAGAKKNQATLSQAKTTKASQARTKKKS